MTAKKRDAWRRMDPFLNREQEKYGRPSPSREFILHYLEERGMPLTLGELCAEWGISDSWEVEALSRRLRAMERDGQLIRNRREGYGSVAKMNLVPGRVIGHPEGHGFLIPDAGGDNLFLSPRQMRKLLHGDRAVARVIGVDYRGRREGAVVEVLERNTEIVVGRFCEERGAFFIVPDNKRINQDIMVPADGRGEARAGQIVIAELIEQPSSQSRPLGRIKEVLGEHMAPGMEVRIAIASHGIPIDWPDAVLAEVSHYGDTVPDDARQGRWDLREIPLVTIDGITARDFDDAVYCEQRGANWRLLVAIADVSWYVQPGTALDQEARKRGNSVYFPDRAIPMLPEVLSNGLCSLNPAVDRLCMVCEMAFNAEGRMIRSRFAEAVMRSQARLTYDTAAAIVADRDPHVRKEYAALVPHLDRLQTLYQVLKAAREQRGAMDFDTQETVIEYGADRKIERILPTERNDAHRLIEECMIAANVAAARFLQRNKIPGLYRIHEGPTEERLKKLRAFLGELGLGLSGGEKPTPRDYTRVLEGVKGRADAHLIQTVMLRSLAQATYSPANAGHFGLALEAYAHFTSPIRRYPDLQVHRAIRHILNGGKAADFPYTQADLLGLGEHCSMTERRADEATRDAVEWLKCEFMLDKIGQVYDGVITGVTGFGLFVELSGVYVEGLIHVTALRNDYYQFDPVGQRLRGDRSGQIYRLGDSLRVRVVRVDLDERKIDFELIESGRRDEKPRSPRSRGPRKKG
ncbi:RNase R, 3'-5' exoribonuclease [Candidatus Competibacter denitrificans Run_A_D11]|uniref:Ribonuclease R n=1 Tax=Candidatus Competibacter denitrificans Run_A_D11 TaxID=1400863 RepID=W6M2H8_9GAMM|nr:ribonuclease R [Candidatus Competibacter denitrificans]CDI01707.1 RNase R, 3'-5' exoribonuclease [Candidatus Competibacter denitrificans Run_A_D11]HRC68865.1 ribonuclease R [Candidatus Competibacter denitrificans]